MQPHKVVLIIMDGWGIGAGDRTDAVAAADTPFIDSLCRTAPHATLLTDGSHVGLPPGQMGNSEVGHLNLGAGRVVMQDLVRIGEAIRDGSFFSNAALRGAQGEALRIEGLARELEVMRGELQHRADASGTSGHELSSDSIHNHRLKAIVERFTIFNHKQAASQMTGLGQEYDIVGAESGDVTLF